MKLRFLFLTIMVAGLCGCSRSGRFDASGVVEHSQISSLVRQAASVANTDWRGGGGADGGSFRARVEIDGDVDEAARASFISSLRSATQKFLADQGATIHGWDKQGNDDNLNGFSWEYTWRKNNGLLRVRYYPGPAGRGHLALLAYEHRRDAAEPPRARGF